MEILGTMNEQTGAHQDAAVHYEQAWKYSRKNQPTIGKDVLSTEKEIEL